MLNAAILISGCGSNLQAIIDAKLNFNVCVVIGNYSASGLARAKIADLCTEVLDHTNFSTRELFDQALLNKLHPYQPDLIILAGFMRILSPLFINAYKDKIINIHPSLLPKYPGLNTHERALEANDKYAGCTVHYVTNNLDAGPIIMQCRVQVLARDTVYTLRSRVLKAEHKLYPEAIKELL